MGFSYAERFTLVTSSTTAGVKECWPFSDKQPQFSMWQNPGGREWRKQKFWKFWQNLGEEESSRENSWPGLREKWSLRLGSWHRPRPKSWARHGRWGRRLWWGLRRRPGGGWPGWRWRWSPPNCGQWMERETGKGREKHRGNNYPVWRREQIKGGGKREMGERIGWGTTTRLAMEDESTGWGRRRATHPAMEGKRAN